MEYLFCGDVHGKFNKFRKLTVQYNNIIQVGDLGVGFSDTSKLQDNFKFIHGNHDNPAVCRKMPQFLGRFGMYDHQTFFLSGAESIDWVYRTEGVSWWRNEELSLWELEQAFDLYMERKPKIMVTHDCPFVLYPQMVSHHVKPNKTAISLDSFFINHKPGVWVFGHHHKNMDFIHDGTRFICLAELETKAIEL